MSHSLVNSADYLAVMLHPVSRKRVMARAVKAAKTLPEFDTVVFTGNSGALFGPELAGRLGKQMLLVNKPGVSRHCSMAVEGAVNIGRWVFADDLISSGDTFFTVRRAVAEWRSGAVFVGAVLYSGYTDGQANPVGRNLVDHVGRIGPAGSEYWVPVAYSFLGSRVTYWEARDQVFSW